MKSWTFLCTFPVIFSAFSSVCIVTSSCQQGRHWSLSTLQNSLGNILFLLHSPSCMPREVLSQDLALFLRCYWLRHSNWHHNKKSIKSTLEWHAWLKPKQIIAVDYFNGVQDMQILKTNLQNLPSGFNDWLDAESLICLRNLALNPVLTPHPHTFQ